MSARESQPRKRNSSQRRSQRRRRHAEKERAGQEEAGEIDKKDRADFKESGKKEALIAPHWWRRIPDARNHIAHIWSTYESRHAKGEKPFARGINSFQFFNDGTRWWVVNIYWEGEPPEHQLPEKYLK